MSFSGNAKASVSAMPPERDCCAAAELRAMLSYASAFDENGLKFIKKSESWLARELKSRHLPLDRVFFLSLDDGGNFTVIEKEKK